MVKRKREKDSSMFMNINRQNQAEDPTDKLILFSLILPASLLVSLILLEVGLESSAGIINIRIIISCCIF